MTTKKGKHPLTMPIRWAHFCRLATLVLASATLYQGNAVAQERATRIDEVYTDVLPAKETPDPEAAVAAFEKALAMDWETEFEDCGTENWKDKWFLDGMRADVTNTPTGMVLEAGPVNKDSSSHMVLWTKQEFEAENIKIEFDFKRLDSMIGNVNILYILATGIGEGPYHKDLTEWNEMREIPGMGKYLRYTNAYHISFAAHREKYEVGKQRIVRARYYPITVEDRNHESDFEPTYFEPGVFKWGETYRITVIKTDERLFMHAKSEDKEKLFTWDITRYPRHVEGRVGIRLMAQRCSRYGNFDIATTE